MLKKLIEIFDCGTVAVITEKTKLPKFALAKLGYSFGRGDTENSNKRTYPEGILIREINKKNEQIKKSKIIGQLEHPLGGTTQLNKAMHIVSNLYYDKSSKLATAESLVLDTTGGRDFMTLLNSGIKMGVSMRGYGNTKDGRVQNDYKLETLDFVLKPAFGADARIDQANIIESANELFTTDENVEKLEEKMLTTLKEFWAQDKSFEGDFGAYKKHYEPIARKVMGITEQEDKVNKMKKTPRKRVEPKDVFYEARLMGISAIEYAKKINEGIDFEAQTASLTEENKSILSAAKLAGMDIATAEAREKILSEWKEREVQIPKTKTLTERAKILAKKTGAKIEVVTEMLKEEETKKAEEKKKAEVATGLFFESRAAGAHRNRQIYRRRKDD